MTKLITKYLVTSVFLIIALSLLPIAPTLAALGAADTLADFEGGVPSGWFTFFGGSTVAATPLNVGSGDPRARPGQTGTNGVLHVDYDVFDFGGFGQSFQVAGPQDWSNYTSFDFWFYGTGSGLTSRSPTTVPTRTSIPPSASTSSSRTPHSAGNTSAFLSRILPAPPTSSPAARPMTASR
jgi:hypothetical protein